MELSASALLAAPNVAPLAAKLLAAQVNTFSHKNFSSLIKTGTRPRTHEFLAQILPFYSVHSFL